LQNDLPEDAEVLVTLIPEDDAQFWLHAGEVSLKAVWDNPEDEVYSRLLESW
jgi:hypothetical protein